MPDFRKILIVKPSSLGDVVHSLPFLDVLRQRFPDAEIHWVIAKGLEGLVEGHSMIDRVIVINKDLWKRISKAGQTIGEIRALFRGLRNEKYDLVADLQGLLRSGVITYATKAPVRIGFASAREGSSLFYTKKVAADRNMHAVDRYLRIAAELGCNIEKVSFPFADTGAADAVSGLPDEYAVIVPGARWKTKIWPAEYFAEVASILSISSVVIGSRADMHTGEEIVRGSGGRAVSLAGQTTLGQLTDIIRKSRIVITNDSGPMHIAAALNIPVVAIFGPTSAARTGPYGKGHVILQSHAECVPCFSRECSTMQCMKDIGPEAVLNAAGQILGKR